MSRFPALPSFSGCVEAKRALVLQLYLLAVVRLEQEPGPEGPAKLNLIRGLKPPAPSGICNLQL